MVGRDANDGSRETALILIAHGSRRSEANQAHLELCGRVSDQLGQVVSPAFLELADPDIATAIDDAVGVRHARHVLLLPYFLHPGNHTRTDIPAIVAAARLRHGAITIDQLDHVGASAVMVGLIADLFAVT